MGMKPWARIGECGKCGTEDSELFEYKRGYFIGKACGCWEEELERDSGRHIRLNKKLEDYRRVVNRVSPRAEGA